LVEKGKELQERKNPKSPEQFSPISRLNRSFDSDQEFGPGSSFRLASNLYPNILG
jgi:hypothetical protein